MYKTLIITLYSIIITINMNSNKIYLDRHKIDDTLFCYNTDFIIDPKNSVIDSSTIVHKLK